MWFSGAAAKRLAGRSVDLAAHIRLYAQREAERRQQRQLEDDRRQQNQREAEAASARVAWRKEKDRERAIACDGKNVHAALWRGRDEVDQWTVDASTLRPPAHMRTASDLSLPTALLGHAAGPQVSPQLLATVVRLVRRADAASLAALFAAQPPHVASMLANLRNRSGDSLLHLCAASQPHMSTLTQLIRARADVNALNSHRDSALHLACAARHHKAIKALLLAHADVEVSNGDERLCWEMPDTSGRARRSGSEDDGQRRLRAFVQLLTSERDADMLAADKQDRQQADDKVRKLWSGQFYRRQQSAQRRKGREWTERQGKQRSSSQSASESSSGTQSPAPVVEVAGWFQDFAEQALSECEAADELQSRRRSSRAACGSGEVDSDHWLYRSSHTASWDGDAAVQVERKLSRERPRRAHPSRTDMSRPQSAVSTQPLPVVLVQPLTGYQQLHLGSAESTTLSAASPRTRHQLVHRPQSRQAHRPQTAPPRTALGSEATERRTRRAAHDRAAATTAAAGRHRQSHQTPPSEGEPPDVHKQRRGQAYLH